MTAWLTEYKDVIAGIAGIATAVGLLATSGAILLAAVQIREQRRLNRANAVYEVQRDAREFAWKLLDDTGLAEAVYGSQPDRGRAAISTAINFYSAVYQMRRHRVLDERIWHLFADDFTRMLANSQAKSQWTAVKVYHDPLFVQEIQARLTQRRKDGGTVQHSGSRDGE